MTNLFLGKAFSVNISKIDKQHKKIAEVFAKLSNAIEKGQPEKAIPGILRELDEYAGYHFDTEEKLMRQHAYPDYEAHKKEHDDFCLKVSVLQQELMEGKITVTREVLHLLTHWLSDHIMNTDKKYSPFLNARGIF